MNRFSQLLKCSNTRFVREENHGQKRLKSVDWELDRFTTLGASFEGSPIHTHHYSPLTAHHAYESSTYMIPFYAITLYRGGKVGRGDCNEVRARRLQRGKGEEKEDYEVIEMTA